MKNNLKKIRKKIGMTQLKLSEKTGISLAMISSLECERNSISVHKAMIIAKTLKSNVYKIWDI